MTDVTDVLAELFETELSCVKYYQGNKAWAYISLLPLFAAVFQLGRFWTSRSIEDGFVFVGFLVTEAINKALKKHFKQERPPTCEQLGVCSSYGYPSSHSQCIWYFITCGSLVLWRQWHLAQQAHAARSAHVEVQRASGTPRDSAPSSSLTADVPATAFALLAAVFCGFAVPASRVVLGYHTVEQVLAGSACGAACGLLWAWVTLGPVGKLAAHICNTLQLPRLLGLCTRIHGASSAQSGGAGSSAQLRKQA